jgi:hypothetical protein
LVVSYRTICVSRDAGAAGEEIGHAVAASLGFRYVDEDILRAAADRTGVDLESAVSVEQRRTLAHKLLDLIAQNGAHDTYAFAPELRHSGAPVDSSKQLPEVISCNQGVSSRSRTATPPMPTGSIRR